jgi:hypothetical protein
MAVWTIANARQALMGMGDRAIDLSLLKNFFQVEREGGVR